MANGNKKIRVTDVITKEDICHWNSINPIIITAGTGVGKSYFIKNILYDYAKTNKQKILMLIHRKLCVEQFDMEIKDDDKGDIVKIITYQKIENNILHDKDLDLEQYSYIVCDEFHYFISDASFNPTTDISFKAILDCRNAVKIFMSATGENVGEYIKLVQENKPIKYSIPFDWSFIDTLSFFYNDACLDEFAKAVIEKGEKAIFFIQNATTAYSFFQKFKTNALFNCSKSNPLYKHVKKDEISDMLRDQKFTSNILVTTSCIDAGVNIIDSDLKYIFVDMTDVNSLIQCIGRKRIQSEDDKVNVYIKAIDNQRLGGYITTTYKQLEMANYLKTHSTEELLKKYPRQIDKTRIIYDEPCRDKDACIKRINELMFRKKSLYINEIETMLNFGEYGYCKYMARKLGKYDVTYDKYDYTVISANFGLENYLETHVNNVMYQVKDRKELIAVMDVRRNRQLKKSREILNSALMEDDIQYRIEKFKTSRMVAGKKKNFNSAWRIVHHDWSVK